MKLDAPKSEPASPVSSDTESLDMFDDAEPVADEPMQDTPEDSGNDDKPFDDTPFDAGVEANEEEDPKKFIEQLTGKLGTSLRKYNDNKGEIDFELEKYIINSIISATHTAEMSEEDQKDIINKIKDAGKGDDIKADEEPSNDNVEDEAEPKPEEPSEDIPTEDNQPEEELSEVFNHDELLEDATSRFENDNKFENDARWLAEDDDFNLNDFLKK